MLVIIVVPTGKYKQDDKAWRYVHVDDMRELGRYIHIHIPYNGGYGPYTHEHWPYVHFEPKYSESNPIGTYRYLFHFTPHLCPSFPTLSPLFLIKRSSPDRLMILCI